MAVKRKCNHELVAGLGYSCCPVCKRKLRLVDQAVTIANSLLGVRPMKIPPGLVENIEKSVEIKEQAGIAARSFMRKVLAQPKVKKELRTRFAPFKKVTGEDMRTVVGNNNAFFGLGPKSAPHKSSRRYIG